MNLEPCELCRKRPPTAWTDERDRVCLRCMVRIDEMREDHLHDQMEAHNDPE